MNLAAATMFIIAWMLQTCALAWKDFRPQIRSLRPKSVWALGGSHWLPFRSLVNDDK